MKSKSAEQILASLAPPGAGIPYPARLLLTWVIKPWVVRKVSWGECEKQFLAGHQKVLAELARFSQEEALLRVLVPKQRGLEDSSRYWSAAMTARHLTIVGGKIIPTIATLSLGQKVSEVADTAAVKPETESNQYRSISEYESFGNGAVPRIQREVVDPNSQLTHFHPWFGEMTAKDWYWLLGAHTFIHLKQLRNIRRGLSGSRN